MDNSKCCLVRDELNYICLCNVVMYVVTEVRWDLVEWLSFFWTLNKYTILKRCKLLGTLMHHSVEFLKI